MTNEEYGNQPVSAIAVGEQDYLNDGMTLHQHFAGLAMQALLASHGLSDRDQFAKFSIEYADALIAQLNQQKEPNDR